MHARVCERVHLVHHKRRSAALVQVLFLLVLQGLPSPQAANLRVAFLTASEKCQQEKRKTVNGEDILFAMTSLGFENYAEALKIYLAKYREVS